MPSNPAPESGSAPAKPTTSPIFAARRRRFAEFLGNTAAIIPAAREAVRSNDTHYVFRQDSDFYYLTGFAEPDAVALFLPQSSEAPFQLFVRPRDPEKETWNGRRAGVERAVAEYGADQAHDIAELDEKLAKALEPVDVLHFGLGRDSELNRRVLDIITGLRPGRARRGTGPVEIRDPGVFLAEQRLRKEAEELSVLRKACDITGEAHLMAMRHTAPGMWEYQVEAVLDYVFRSRGASGWGYPHIVAGGINGTILHYTENDQQLKDGELLLIDAGAEYGGYTGDVTRTFPIGAAFSRDQRVIYDLVLRSQLAAMDEIKPGVPFDAYHKRTVQVLTEGLVELGVLQGAVEELIEKEAYKPFYMHRTGHWLGLDVHDVGLYVVDGDQRPLEPGMVLTVEPGLYFGEFCGEIDPRWKGIGVRIEDDVLVTENGCENLTAACPKEAGEVEALRRRSLAGERASELVLPLLS
jgi:Xaa-Pro aminopeptidase